jgi:hypothetical protein
MPVNPAQSLLITIAQVVQIANVIDPNIVLDGDDNGVDLKAVINTETGSFSHQILASDIQAGNWQNIATACASCSTAAGDSPGSIQ